MLILILGPHGNVSNIFKHHDGVFKRIKYVIAAKIRSYVYLVKIYAYIYKSFQEVEIFLVLYSLNLM